MINITLKDPDAKPVDNKEIKLLCPEWESFEDMNDKKEEIFKFLKEELKLEKGKDFIYNTAGYCSMGGAEEDNRVVWIFEFRNQKARSQFSARFGFLDIFEEIKPDTKSV